MTMPDPTIESPLAHLSDEQIEAIGKEFDAIHDEVFSSLGDRDAHYIRTIIALHRQLALLVARDPARLALQARLAARHRRAVHREDPGEHGDRAQRDARPVGLDAGPATSTPPPGTGTAPRRPRHGSTPTTTSTTPSPTSAARTRTSATRSCAIDPHQPWHPVYLLQPVYNLVLAAFFEWGVAAHDLDFEAIKSGEKSKAQVRRELRGMGHKAWRQIVKDYIAFPALSGTKGLQGHPEGELHRQHVRNVWSYAIIFCGHFPDQTYTFSQEEVEDETRGGFYVRQLLGAANIEGSPIFHVLSRQPRLPGRAPPFPRHALEPLRRRSRRRCKDICERYELPYNTGRFGKQLGTVQRTILRLAFPGGKPLRKPGPYRPVDDDAITRPLIAV